MKFASLKGNLNLDIYIFSFSFQFIEILKSFMNNFMNYRKRNKTNLALRLVDKKLPLFSKETLRTHAFYVIRVNIF